MEYTQFSQFDPRAVTNTPYGSCVLIDPAQYVTPYTKFMRDLRAVGEREHTQGRARLVRRPATRGTYRFEGLHGVKFYELPATLDVCTLQTREHGKWRTYMVDEALHWFGMAEYCKRITHGRVLCAGLGLGLMLWHLTANPNIESITVVEQNADVVDLVQPFLPVDARVSVVVGDYYDYIERQFADAVLRDLNGAGNLGEVQAQWFEQLSNYIAHPPFEFVLFDLAVGDVQSTTPTLTYGTYMTAAHMGGAHLVRFGVRNDIGIEVVHNE